MKTHSVVENDIDMEEIWRDARSAGFTDIKLAIFQVQPFLVDLVQFEDFLEGGKTTRKFVAAARAFLSNQRNFFLWKGEPKPRDSRYRQGLTALITISPTAATIAEGKALKLPAVVRNNSEAMWLPQSADLGAVLLGCHVYHADGTVFRESYHWEPLTPNGGRVIKPGETVEFIVTLPALPRGSYTIEFDMVSNNVCWFAVNGSQVARVEVEVLAGP